MRRWYLAWRKRTLPKARLVQIVHELAHWPSDHCQSCHNDPRNPQGRQYVGFGRRAKAVW